METSAGKQLIKVAEELQRITVERNYFGFNNIGRANKLMVRWMD